MVRCWPFLLLGGLILVAGCSPSPPGEYHELTELPPAVPQSEPDAFQQADSPAASGAFAPPADAPTTSPDDDLTRAAAEERIAERDRAAQAEFDRARAELLGLGTTEDLLGEPREITLLVPDKEFKREGKERALRITYDDIDLLKVLNMERVIPEVMEYLPDWLKELHGQRVVLRGWMRPGFRDEGITAFIFVRDNGTCCFGPQAKIYDKVGVRLKAGTSTRFIDGRPFDLVGTFALRPDFEDPSDAWLYFMDDAVILER